MILVNYRTYPIMVEPYVPVPMLRIRDVYPESEFFNPESRIQGQKDSGSRIRIKDFPQNSARFLSSRKNDIYVHPGSGYRFFNNPDPDPGVKNTGSGSATPVCTWIARVVCRVVGERGLTSRNKELLSIPLKNLKLNSFTKSCSKFGSISCEFYLLGCANWKACALYICNLF